MIWVLLGIIAILVLLLLSAFFSGAEVALISLNRARVRSSAEKGVGAAKIAHHLLSTPDKLLGTILVGNNLVNILASIIAGAIAIRVFGDIGIGIATFAMVLIILIFCELTPKAFALRNERFAYRVGKPISMLTKIFYPVVTALTFVSNAVIKAFGGREKPTKVTESEIKAMLQIGEEEGTIERDERELISEVFEFDETTAREVMIPRREMVCVDVTENLATLLKIVNSTGYSRIPVYHNTINNVIGMVHAKDLLKAREKKIAVKDLMRPILKVKDLRKADEVLREMQRKNTHLAVVQNDKGKTLGLVTMEDLIEEIVGEIRDEHDIGA